MLLVEEVTVDGACAEEKDVIVLSDHAVNELRLLANRSAVRMGAREEGRGAGC